MIGLRYFCSKEENTMKLNDKMVEAGFGLIAVTGVGIAMYFGSKMSKVAKKLSLSIDDLEGRTDVEIAEDVVKAAVESAAKREAEKAVYRAVRDITSSTETDMRKRIGSAIDMIYNDMKGKVTEEMKKQVSNMSPEDLKKEIRKDAKKAMLDKLEDSMDDILDEYKDQIKVMSRIYGNLASK